jgi:translocation and assembly module TamA
MIPVPARLWAAIAACALAANDARAQSAAEASVGPDASQDMTPLQDLGVAWPELESSPPQAAAPGDERESDIRYRVEASGLADVDLQQRYRDLSVLGRSGKVDNLAQLDRRAREDGALIDRLLRATGYYAGEVDVDISPAESVDGEALVALRIVPGPRYSFGSIEIVTPRSAPLELIRRTLGLNTGDPVDATAIQAAEDRVRLRLPELGFPFATVGERDIEIDHETRTAKYRIDVLAGQRARIGTIRVEGNELVDAEHVGRLARFRSGDLYDQADIEDLRRAMVATGLFGSVGVRATEAAPGVVDVVVSAQPAPLRTVAGQAGYSTGEGIRVEASWQHRNFVPPEGALTVRGVAGTREQRLAGELRFSNFRERDRVLLLRSEVSHEDRDAYEARSFTVGGRLERETNLIWQKTWTYSVGAELIATDERDTDIDLGISRRRTFLIAALPASLAYDGTDDLLDPSSGFRLSGRLSPEISFQDSAFAYLRGQIDASTYAPVAERVVLAGRVRAGSIFGADRDRIAPSRRFYAGGGGSVRGFGYQEIGPRDPFNDPIGGRSVAEASVEARIRLGDFGVVPFVDAGQIYTSTLPRFDSFRFGAGIGVRYYTGFGPIRIDVATPLDPRRGDPDVGVYVSIGQAF